jgi:hypothetical protein
MISSETAINMRTMKESKNPLTYEFGIFDIDRHRPNYKIYAVPPVS